MSDAQEGALELTRSRIHADFPTSPCNPNLWPKRKQWTVTITVSVSGFISTCGSSIAVATVHAIGKEFHQSNEKITVLITALYIFGMGMGPFIFAPISELWGRQTAYISSQVLFIIFSAACVAAQSLPALIVLRLLVTRISELTTALLACVARADPPWEWRPWRIYFRLKDEADQYHCMRSDHWYVRFEFHSYHQLGPTLGSMLGYWLLLASWRWTFGVMVILASLNLAAMLYYMEETYAPVIQRKMMYQATHPLPKGNWSPHKAIASLKWMKAMVSRGEAQNAFQKAFSRPPRLLLGNPVALLFSLYYSYIYGLIYLFLVSIPLLFGSAPYSRPSLFTYGWPQATLPLSYLGLGLGYCTAAFLAATYQDRIYKYLVARKAKKMFGLEEKVLSRDEAQRGEPEFRLVLTQIGMILLPIGLLIFGWTAYSETHWIFPTIGGYILAVGLMIAFNSLQTWFVECFYPYSAAAMAGATFTRSLIGAILPIFAGDMFVKLDWGLGGTLLAGVALIAVPAPAVMFLYGRQYRERYKFTG